MKRLLVLALALTALAPEIGQAGEVCENGFGSMNGLNSVNGLSGANGLSSINGLSGANGLSSINGLATINGLSAMNGLAGINGLNSINGFNTANGLSSINGFNTANGLSSINGFNTANGLSSINGLSGANGLSSINGLNSVNGLPPAQAAGAPTADGKAVSKTFANWLEYPFGIPASETAALKISHAWKLRDPTVASTEQGRQLLKYFTRCALPEGQALVAEVAGQTHVFPGRVGLAPKWVVRPMNESEQRWVSACLLAHVNAHGVHVPIDIRGPHPRLAGMTDEDRKFPIEEGAFFGNLFIESGARPTANAFTCMGSRGEKDALSQFLKLRSCTEILEKDSSQTVCGFGPCGECATKASCVRGPGYFERCRDPRTGKEYAEVVTVYLMR